MTLRVSYPQLENLINYFERDQTSWETIHQPEYSVTAEKRTAFDKELIFTIKFPRSYIQALPMQKAIELILGGEYEVQVCDES